MSPRESCTEHRWLDCLKGKIGIPTKGIELSPDEAIETSIREIKLWDHGIRRQRCDEMRWDG
jgi:hypothetical protein